MIKYQDDLIEQIKNILLAGDIKPVCDIYNILNYEKMIAIPKDSGTAEIFRIKDIIF